MRIYLDNCCFNRPFDEQKQTRIRLESEAKLCIQEHIRDGHFELIWSYILDLENDVNPFKERRIAICDWKQYAIEDIEETQSLLQEANILLSVHGLKPKDALHISCAVAGQCQYFITTDDQILKMGSSR